MSENGVEEILQSLKKIKGILGAVIVEKYGVITESALPGWLDEDAVAAMITLILRATERQAKELNQGEFQNAIIENARGKMVMTVMGDKIIAVMTTSDMKLGILDLKLKSARERLINPEKKPQGAPRPDLHAPPV